MSETTLTYLDGYCERAGMPGLMAEPIDVISNIGFLIAAYLAFRAFRTSGRSLKNGWDMALLILLLTAIGIGSALWHLFANSWSLLGDVIPILLFINVYLLSFFIRVLKWKPAPAIGWFLAFQGLNMASENFLPRDLLNGSIMYVPTLLTLGAIALYLQRKGHKAAKEIVLVLGIFAASITFRTVDMAVCGMVPIGTHFLWHGLNSVVLYRLLRLLITGSGGRQRTQG